MCKMVEVFLNCLPFLKNLIIIIIIISHLERLSSLTLFLLDFKWF